MMYQQPSSSFCLKLILTSIHYLRLVSLISSSIEDLFPFRFLQTSFHHLFCLLYLSIYLYYCPISLIEKISPSVLASHFLPLYCLYPSFSLEWYSVAVFIFSPLIGSSNKWTLASTSTTIQTTNGSHQWTLHWLIQWLQIYYIWYCFCNFLKQTVMLASWILNSLCSLFFPWRFLFYLFHEMPPYSLHCRHQYSLWFLCPSLTPVHFLPCHQNNLSKMLPQILCL